jgi:pimeloyl-ACP methyl ester carboxylesterase
VVALGDARRLRRSCRSDRRRSAGGHGGLGQRGPHHPPAQAEPMAAAVHHLLDGTGYMPHMERSAEVQAAIEETIATAG